MLGSTVHDRAVRTHRKDQVDTTSTTAAHPLWTRRPWVRRPWVLGGAAALLAAGGVLAVAGWSIWPLAAVVMACLAGGVARFAGWGLGVAAAVAVPLAAVAWGIRLYHKVGLTVATGNLVLLAVLALVALVLLAVGPRAIRPRRADLITALLPAAVVPAAVGVFFAFLPTVRDGLALSWAMHNDAVWNLVSARFILNDHGLIPSLHPNSSPLTAVLIASGLAPGRSGVQPSGYLQHDIAAMAVLFALSTVLASLIAGLVSAWAIPAQRPVLRALGAVLGSALIASWFVAGFSFQLGFYNVMPSLACLFAAWLSYLRGAASPVWALALLLVDGTALLALWAPLAVVPVTLAAVVALRGLVPRLRAVHWTGWVLLALSAVQIAAYVLLFSLPDLRRDHEALAGGGQMAPVSPAVLFISAGLAIAVSGSAARAASGRWALVGVVVAVLGLSLGYAYLGMQVSADHYWWGYYSAKLTWLGGVLLIVIALSAAFAGLATAPLERWPRIAAAFGTVTVLVALAASVLPKVPTVSALVPYLDIVGGTGVSARDNAVPTLFALSDPRERAIVAKYSTPDDDYFTNGWLLGLPATSGTDPIRTWAYYMDATKPELICPAMSAWGGGVTVYTRSDTLEERLDRLCPDLGARVIVGDVPRG